MQFTEEKYENDFTEVVGHVGYRHYFGITLTGKQEDVLLEGDLQNFLLSLYSEHEVTVI